MCFFVSGEVLLSVYLPDFTETFVLYGYILVLDLILSLLIFVFQINTRIFFADCLTSACLLFTTLTHVFELPASSFNKLFKTTIASI